MWQRLQDRLTGKIRICRAADLAAAEREQKGDTCYVVPLDASATENEFTGTVQQVVTHAIGIVMVARNHRGKRGAEAVNDVEALRASVAQALIGWRPAGGIGPLTYRRGAMLKFESSSLWWQDEYLIDSYLIEQLENN